MKFFLSFFFPAMLGFLFSCSSGKQFSGTAAWGSYKTAPVAQAIVSTESIAISSTGTELELTTSTAPALASQISTPDYPKPELLSKPSAQSINPGYVELNRSNKIAVDVNGPANVLPKPDKLRKFGMMSMIAGVLSFLPFVLGLSLLYSIPFAIAGIIFGRIALRSKVGTYRQDGEGLAKAGLLLSGVVAIILVLLGALALFG